jgi:hypothetical protein
MATVGVVAIIGLVIIVVTIFIIVAKTAISNNRCTNGGKQHQFRPRYTEQDRGWSLNSIKGSSPSELRDLMTLKIYAYDICEWCGEIRKDEHLTKGCFNHVKHEKHDI